MAVIIRQGRFLVIRRSQGVVAPGSYCFPGGAIEPGETQQAAVVREIKEELGVEVRPVRRLWESVTPWDVHLTWWKCELDEQLVPVPNPAEVESLEWLDPSEMAARPGLLESNRHFLEAMARGVFEA